MSREREEDFAFAIGCGCGYAVGAHDFGASLRDQMLGGFVFLLLAYAVGLLLPRVPRSASRVVRRVHRWIYEDCP